MMAINVIETNLKFTGNPGDRKTTDCIVIHHSESPDVSAATIHDWHLGRGWKGIAYHYVVRQDGTIERGRPEKWIGGHTEGHNWHTIGICFAGSYMAAEPRPVQLSAGAALVRDILARWGALDIKPHRDLGSTDCPGNKFPWVKFMDLCSKGGKEKVKINICKDGGYIDYAEGYKEGDTSYGPVRKIGEAMGGKVNYDDSIKTVTIEPDTWTVEMDGKTFPGIVSLDRGYVAIRELAAMLGKQVDFQEKGKKIVLK
jgi:hypothetical protein